MNPVSILAKLGGRKFLLTAFIVLAATALRCFNLLTEAGLLTAWTSALGMFGLANVSQKAVTKANTSTTKEAP